MFYANNKVAVIMLAGDKQNECFWPSYNTSISGYKHDLIIIHRDLLGVPESIKNDNGDVIFLNKIINGVDVPHRAFGGYRFGFNNYKNNYDIFVFISDDVVIKRDNWLLDIVNILNTHEKLGFGASQIFNGGKKYPHDSHLRAPFWFAKTTALDSIDWEFDNDHDGEMKIGNQLTNSGFFGVQLGNKLTLAYDVMESNHITQILELTFFKDKFPLGKYSIEEFNFFDKLNDVYINSPYPHINKQNVLIDLEPFDGLIFLPSLDIAKKYIKINKKHNSFII